MIIRTIDGIAGTERDRRGLTWRSRRLLRASDAMDVSVHWTEIPAGAESTLWYKHHLESNLCVAGTGEVVDLDTGETHQLCPGVMYALDRHDRHVLRAHTDMTLVCTFTPPLVGDESHDADGSYLPSATPNRRNYLTAMFGLEHTIRMVPADRWDDPTPCSDWTARQLAGHAVGVVSNIAARAGVGTAVDVFEDLDAFAGPDPLVTAREARTRLLEALDRPGVLAREVRSSLGVMAFDGYLGLMVPDTLIHTWDLARAAGLDERLDPALVDHALADLQQRPSEVIRAPRHYHPEIDASTDADAQTRLLLFAGRDLSFRPTERRNLAG